MELEKLLETLKYCTTLGGCADCPAVNACCKDGCFLETEAVKAIEQLIAERDAAVAGLADYRDCLYCKHYGKTRSEPPCNSCSSRREAYRLGWEWCGHVPKGGVKVNV